MPGRIHQAVWGTCVALTVAGVLAYAVAYGTLARVLLLSATLALFAASFAYVVFEESPDRRLWMRRLVLWAGLGAPLADGLTTAIGPMGLLVMLVLVASSPALVGLVRRRFAVRLARGPVTPLGAQSERELLKRWEGTSTALQRGRMGVAARLALVDERSRLLDELELRDPERFGEWMATLVPEVRGGRRDSREA
jgi:hypothetical protein